MKGTKFVIGFTFLLSAASLAGNWFLYQRFSQAQALRDQLESKVVQLEERGSNLQSQLTQYEEETHRLREQIKGYVSQRDSVKKELDQALKETGDLKKQVKDLESQKQTLTQQAKLREVTEQAIVQEAVKLPLPPAPTAAPAIPAPSKSPEKSPKKSSTPKPSAPPQAKGAEKADQRPYQILSLNRQFNFVVVNVGIRDHIKIGDKLRVEQNGKLVGQLQVEKLYENFSACTILEEPKPNRIQEGDLVRIA